MTKDLDILILAAGLGTRMKSNRAKVLHQVDGRPLVNHVVGAALALDPKSVCVIVGHQAEEVKAVVNKEFPDERVCFALQEKQRGTGDAIKATHQLYGTGSSTIAVLTGDVPLITTKTISSMVEQHQREGVSATILAVKLDDPTGYGRVVRDRDGGFARIVEQKDATDQERAVTEINAGFYCFASSKLYECLNELKNENAQSEYYLTDVPALLKAKDERVGIFVASDAGEVEGVNDRRQLAGLENVLRQKTIDRLMLDSGVTFVDTSSGYVSARATVGRDTVIHPNVTIEGISTIGEGCIIRPGVRIVNSNIGSNVEIRDNSFITDSTVGDGCTVGPMAHLRGHAVMEDGSKVGNFVELKKTVLGKGSKASHLTYLGDATIGVDTNIGAGTVTCNYDGKNKHETHIGDNVRIGSDTMLIAPVRVGDNSATGAGSVVTKDIEPETLVAGVPARPLKKKEDSAESSNGQRSSPEQITAQESLSRMNSFADRKEKFVAAVEKSKN